MEYLAVFTETRVNLLNVLVSCEKTCYFILFSVIYHTFGKKDIELTITLKFIFSDFVFQFMLIFRIYKRYIHS